MGQYENHALSQRFGEAIPEGIDVTFYHLHTNPSRCAALYNPPPKQKPEKTYCAHQTLLLTSSIDGREVVVYAIELEIYNTAYLTTVFVSKADSTGFLSLLNLPRNAGSLLQSVTSTFVSDTIRKLHSPKRRLVISLFARAQDQYLFPGSIENGHKHVLDDRQLIKWWCKTLQPILQEYDVDSELRINGHARSSDQPGLETIKATAHLVVPGIDSYETRSYFPEQAKTSSRVQKQWSANHPLREIAPYHPSTPPRSLIPHFPDDPKARFLNELDEECTDAPNGSKPPQNTHQSPTKRGAGQWKSVKTLEQFWEVMGFRQECSAGRLVGFLWIVFTPDNITDPQHVLSSSSTPPTASKKRKATENADLRAPKSRSKRDSRSRKRKLTGTIISRTPRVKNSSDPATMAAIKVSHGEGIGLSVSEKAYNRVHDLLLRLDFANLQMATSSTKKWIDETAVIASMKGSSWGMKVTGSKRIDPSKTGPAIATQSSATPVTMLAVKKKPKPAA